MKKLMILLSALLMVGIVSASSEIIYQEDADINSFVGDWDNPTLAFDGDYDTFGNITDLDDGGASLIQTYNLPKGGINNITWQIKSNTGLVNFSVPLDCFSDSNTPNKIVLQAQFFKSIPARVLLCVYVDGGGTPKQINLFVDFNAEFRLYEEAVFWNRTILPPTIFIRYDNQAIQIPYTLFLRHDDGWAIDVPKTLFKRFDKWVP